MKQLKKFTIETVRKFGPCYDPIKHLNEVDQYTILDILRNENISFEDKLWLTLRTDFISERTMRLFAVWSYRQTLSFISNPDSRSIECANVSERFAKGEATQNELDSARSAAWSAARSAAESAARSAARSAVESAVESARAAAWSAAESAWSAARSAVESAVESARAAAWSAAESAWSAAESARSAAWSAAESAWSAQNEKLIQMVIDGVETGDTVLE